MSLLIVGNPPYNGIAHDAVKNIADLTPFLPDGKHYRTHYSFMALERRLLKPGERMLFIVPHKWLIEDAAKPLREELFKDGKLAHLEVMSQPVEWNASVEIGQVAVFMFEKGRAEHASSVLCTADGRFPNVSSPIGMSILQKVMSSHPTLPRVTFFRGPGGKLVEGSPERDYIQRHNVRSHGPLVISSRQEDRIDIAKSNGEQFVLYPDFARAPFKHRVDVVEPMPVHDTFVAVPSKTPGKHIALVESTLAKLVWRCFFARHFAPALTDLLPDITSLLSDTPTEADINAAFGLTSKEAQYVAELTKTYGKDM